MKEGEEWGAWQTMTSSSVDFELAEGTYYIKTRATDTEGNTSESEVAGPIEVVVIKTLVGGIDVEEIVAAGKQAELYGQRVQYGTNSSIVWRIFYIDTENKYGDGENTIYLKADYNQYMRINIAYKYTNEYEVKSSYPIMERMNQKWRDANDGTTTITSESTRGRKAAAYMCDPDVWSTTYATSLANYAIGSPSVDMYVDSYNEAYPNKNMSCSYSGYGYSYTNGSNLTTERNSMYSREAYGQSWFLASPGASSDGYVCEVYSGGRSLSDTSWGNASYEGAVAGYCPLVSLKSGITLKALNEAGDEIELDILDE